MLVYGPTLLSARTTFQVGEAQVPLTLETTFHTSLLAYSLLYSHDILKTGEV